MRCWTSWWPRAFSARTRRTNSRRKSTNKRGHQRGGLEVQDEQGDQEHGVVRRSADALRIPLRPTWAGSAAVRGVYDAADRWRYALRIGVRGDLADDFYYGLRLETSPNERSTWNTFGNGGGTRPITGRSARAATASISGWRILGWRPTSWLDVSVGRVPQPLYTTPMVWDSDYTPEGAVEKIKYTYGPVDYFATFGTVCVPGRNPGECLCGGGRNECSGFLGDFSDHNAYLLAWQLGADLSSRSPYIVQSGARFLQLCGTWKRERRVLRPVRRPGNQRIHVRPDTSPSRRTPPALPGAYGYELSPQPATTRLASIIWPSLNSRWR